MRNLLSSFTRHRHIIHAGYTFSGNGSWILQVKIYKKFFRCSVVFHIFVIKKNRRAEVEREKICLCKLHSVLVITCRNCHNGKKGVQFEIWLAIPTHNNVCLNSINLIYIYWHKKHKFSAKNFLKKSEKWETNLFWRIQSYLKIVFLLKIDRHPNYNLNVTCLRKLETNLTWIRKKIKTAKLKQEKTPVKKTNRNKIEIRTKETIKF